MIYTTTAPLILTDTALSEEGSKLLSTPVLRSNPDYLLKKKVMANAFR